MIYDRILRSMTDRAARTAAAGSWGDLGLRLIDDFDDDLADGTIARFPTGILSLRSSCPPRIHEAGTPLRGGSEGPVTFDHCEVCKPVYPC